MFCMTPSREDYLKAIYTLNPADDGTRVVEIAAALSVTKASVSRMMDQLEKEGFVRRSDKKRITLTSIGRSQAQQVKKRYEVIRLYFLEVLHVDGQTAAEDACCLEHILSEGSLAAMRKIAEQAANPLS